jgi:hypothetical protein
VVVSECSVNGTVDPIMKLYKLLNIKLNPGTLGQPIMMKSLQYFGIYETCRYFGKDLKIFK